MQYWQLDVFAERPLAGNGLAVFDDARGLSASAMQGLTQELRQFESIFLLPGGTADTFSARIFTAEEELPFAGHPIIGAAALLHHLHSPAQWQTVILTACMQRTLESTGQAVILHCNIFSGCPHALSDLRHPTLLD